jgi:4-amino-4-deoxy-L-arabinose transferase-like glycosyltransferase
VLSTIGLFGINIVVAARWLNVLLLVLTIFLAGLIFIRHSSSPELSIAASLLLALFPTTVRLFTSALSEPLCIGLLFLAVFCLLEYLKSRTTRWFVLTALVTSLVPLTRYVGVALIPAAVVVLLVFLQGSAKERLGKAVLFGILSSLPILLWYLLALPGGIRSNVSGGWETSFDWRYLPSRVSDFSYSLMQIIPRWIPFSAALIKLRLRYLYGGSLALIVGVTVAAIMANRQVSRRDASGRASRDMAIFGLFGGWVMAYFVVLALATFFTNSDPAISNRMLLPAYCGIVSALIAAMAACQDAWFRGKRRWMKAVLWVIVLWGSIFYGPGMVREVMLPARTLSGPDLTATSYVWRNSETIAAVRNLPENVVIVSNESYAIQVWTGRPAHSMVEEMRTSFIDQDVPYGADTSDPAQAAFSGQGAALVVFGDELPYQLKDNFGEAGTARLETLFTGLVVGGRYADGVIYYSP